MPTTQLHTRSITDAVALACRAPSLHNSQPWRWVVTGQGVDLYADPSRMIRATDSTGREALISCGAVLDHFRVAMTAAGWDTVVHRLPDPADPLHVATIEFAAATRVTDEQGRRADAILLRRSDRLPMAAPPDWDRLAGAFVAAAQRGPVQVHAVADGIRDPLTEASHIAEAIRLFDAAYHSEIDWWTAGFSSDDGIPRSSLISAAESDRVGIGRTFPVTAAPERRGHVDEDHAGILVFATEDESAESVLRCGEALSAVLLEAAMAGMATCTVTHITEIPEGRAVVASLIGTTAVPQALVRVGLAPSLDATPPPTPRRPIHDVVEIRRGSTC